MIFLDTNYLVRLIVEPQNAAERRMSAAATQLMKQVAEGRERVTTSDAVIAETVFALSGKQFQSTRDHIADGLTVVVQLSGFVSSQKSLWLHALEVWRTTAGLSFADALGAVYSIQARYQLATFDKHLARHSGLKIYPGHE